MEPECSLLYSSVPATCPCPESAQSSINGNYYYHYYFKTLSSLTRYTLPQRLEPVLEGQRAKAIYLLCSITYADELSGPEAEISFWGQRWKTGWNAVYQIKKKKWQYSNGISAEHAFLCYIIISPIHTEMANMFPRQAHLLSISRRIWWQRHLQ